MRTDHLKVPVEKLRYSVDLKTLKFENTSEVHPLKTFVGQKRAKNSLRFGLDIKSPGHNIFVTGLPNSGRTSLINQEVKNAAKKKTKQKEFNLEDVCYVYNFDNPDKPKILVFNQGQAKKFQTQIRYLLTDLRKLIENAFSVREFVELRQQVMEEFYKETDKLKMAMKKKIREKHFVFKEDEETGIFDLIPMSKGHEDKLMSLEERSNLPPGIEEKINKNDKFLRHMMRRTNDLIDRLEQEAFAEIRSLKDTMFQAIVKRAFEAVFKKLDSSNKQALEYLADLELWVMRHESLFEPEEKMPKFPFAGVTHVRLDNDDPFLPFSINVVVDNNKTDDPPIIFEEHPTFPNLFGHIDKRIAIMGYSTDHTLIKAGSIALANGGYLVIRAEDILANPGAWQKLKKTLATGFLKIEDPFESYFRSVSLNPDPIPINVKVVIICEPILYYLLTIHDKGFLDVFKVKVEFDTEMNRDPGSFKSYTGFVSFCCNEENLLPFKNSAVGEIIEYGIRLTDDQKKISTRLGKIKDLITESDYWARKLKSSVVKDIHVKRALKEKRQRVSLTEEKYQELIEQGQILIDVDGKKLGEINALPVSAISEDFSFGFPIRITARVFLGRKGVISIQREVELSGSQHDTGVLKLSGYISGKYGKDKLIPYSVSISFEQLMGAIDGSSASVAELLAIFSALSDLPIDQRWAVTGSMNQKGEVHPVGGINQKIEGFFDICEKKGLTGKQGVIIPFQNIDNLMLKQEIVKTVKKRKFYVYTIKTIDDAIELIFECPVQEFHDLINTRIQEAVVKLKAFGLEIKE